MKQTFLNIIFAWFCIVCLVSCGDKAGTTPRFHESGNPQVLSEWSLFARQKGILKPADRVLPYDLNTPLFSDYAQKFRTVWMPEGVTAKYHDDDTFSFPVGTIITKTFYYPKGQNEAEQVLLRTSDMSLGLVDGGLDLDQVRLVETRLLIHREAGWVALPYVWNDAQTEAVLKRTGDIQELQLASVNGDGLKFPYVVPNSNQCAGCHATNATTRALEPIGLKARHLNKVYAYPNGSENQLSKLTSAGFLVDTAAPGGAPQAAIWTDISQTVDARARAYLDINCAHCHNEVGPADTSGLHFEPETLFGPHLGICKVSVSAGAGTGGHLYDIDPGNADESIMIYRMASTDPGVMMPEVGRSIVHEEGLALMRDWVAEMPGSCE